MSFASVLWAFDQEISPKHKLVLAVVASYENPKNGLCFPKLSSVARKASMSVRTARRYISDLRKMGLITTKPRWGDNGSRQSNAYVLARGISGDPLVRRGKGGTVTVDRFYNHNLNHKQIGHSGRDKPTIENAANQKALNEIVARFGQQGWEIVTHFNRDVPLLVGKQRRGVLRDDELAELKLRYLKETR